MYCYSILKYSIDTRTMFKTGETFNLGLFRGWSDMAKHVVLHFRHLDENHNSPALNKHCVVYIRGLSWVYTSCLRSCISGRGNQTNVLWLLWWISHNFMIHEVVSRINFIFFRLVSTDGYPSSVTCELELVWWHYWLLTSLV